MSKRAVEVDWERYADAFPDRYIDDSPFDTQVEAVLSAQGGSTALDVGGGKHGTRSLNRDALRCWLLDPFVAGHPPWMEGHLNWSEAVQMRFDFILARGSFNYLTEEQIRALPAMLNPAGHLMFNTFYRARSGSREYHNARSGERGVERFVYRPERGIVEHELEPEGRDFVIRHTFFVYNLDQIVEMLGPLGLSFKFTRPNSLLVTLVK